MNEPGNFQRPVVKIVAGAIFAALVAVATLLFWVPILATNGGFNLGDTLIYVAALLLGPMVGAFAGVGATISDSLVAVQFAPGTFVIKGIEGLLVGFLYKKLGLKIKSITICASIAIVIGGLEMVSGYFLYEILILGYPIAQALVEVPLNIIQMLSGLVIAVPVMHGVLKVFPQLKS